MKKLQLQKNHIRYTVTILLWLLLLIFLIRLFIPYQLENTESTKVYDRYGELLYDVRDDYRQKNYQTLDEIPEFLQDFLMQKEDQRFRNHRGFDLRAFGRALTSAIRGEWIQWASTIDQQVIKLSQQAFANRSIRQKIKEINLALNINLRHTKEEIFLYYVNNLHFPYGVKGFETACDLLFQKKCSDLSNGHLLYLYAKAKFPNKYSIISYLETIAAQFGLENYSRQDREHIKKELYFFPTSKARHYVEYTLNIQTTSETEIHTNFDTQLRENIQATLELFEPHLNRKNAHHACVMVLENGEIASMNILPRYGQNNLFLNACLRPRQVGSAIKPFVYTLAFDHLDYDAQTKIMDEQVEFTSLYGYYSPKNFDLEYHGEVSLAQALGSSLNVPAVKLAHELWIGKLYGFYKTVWNLTKTNEQRRDDIQDLWLWMALWIKEISPLDFTKMRSIFAKCENNQTDGFCKKYGEELAEVKEILTQNHNRLLSFPQYNRFDIPDVYGKSWTSRHFVDGWMCGGVGEYTVCMWAGNYSTEPMRDSGHQVLGPVWGEVMRRLRD